VNNNGFTHIHLFFSQLVPTFLNILWIHWMIATWEIYFQQREILAVPLLDCIQEDKLIRNGEKDDIYSVRSGYKKFMKEKENGSRPRDEEAWGKLWKIQTPPKAKHLLWHICKGCLPTRSRLRNHYVNCQVECLLCSYHKEEEMHLLFECEASNRRGGS
jgi:hypothetical protein